MTDRDPLVNPIEGDKVVLPNGKYRIVISRRGGDIIYSYGGVKTRTCWISTWIEWCQKNKAVAADNQHS